MKDVPAFCPLSSHSPHQQGDEQIGPSPMHCHLHVSFFKKYVQFINYALMRCLHSHPFEGIGSPGAVAIDSFELLSGCWKFNPGPCPLKEHGVPNH